MKKLIAITLCALALPMYLAAQTASASGGTDVKPQAVTPVVEVTPNSTDAPSAASSASTSKTTSAATPASIKATTPAGQAGAKCAAVGHACCANKAKASNCAPKPGCNHANTAQPTEPQ